MIDDLQSRLQAVLGDAYRIERELTRGGMSYLFLATEVSLNRRIVIKLLPPELTSEVSAARFRQEIEVVAKLQHPHILPVLATGSGNGLLYYIMPYVAGESLRHRLSREGRLPIVDAVRFLQEMADALAYAHSHGVIHRDVKPENILIEAGHAVLTDFGVARARAEAASGRRLTQTGMGVGTPGYMAPEQAAGEPRTDARVDVYSLAVVGYEMLAGSPPFEGPTSQALLTAHLTVTPRQLEQVREDTPAGVSAAIDRGLAKDPRDRFQTAAEFRDALSAPAAPGQTRARQGRRWMAAVAAGLVVVAGAGMLLRRSATPPPLDANLVAVAPFDVLGADPDLALWREGLVDVLARNLDGAGPLRTVSPTVAIRRWRGRADPTAAQELGRLTGAGIAVVGRIVPAGGDSVRLAATVVNVASGAAVADLELRDVSGRMDRLADSLTVAVLRELGRTRPIGAVRLTSVGSTSLPALKAFLQGEQFFRRTVWDSAVAYYERAIAIDSTFAPALRHLGLTLGWVKGGGDSLGRAHQFRAGALNHGLSPRDSLLTLADSLSAAMWGFGNDPDFERHTERLFATLEGASRRYPDDPEVWYELGDAQFHFGQWRGVTRRQALETFDRAIALDSAFAPAYIHPVELALEQRGPSGALRYAAAYLAVGEGDGEGQGIPLVARLLDPVQSRSPELTRLVDTASAPVLWNAYQAIQRWPDSAETALGLIRRIAGPRRDSLPFSTWWPLANQLAYRGHVREATALAGDRARGLVVEFAATGAISTDSATRQMSRWLVPAPAVSAQAGLPWWAAQGDTAAVHRLLRHAGTLARNGTEPSNQRVWRFVEARARAYLALARGDTTEALRQLTTLSDSLCAACGSGIEWLWDALNAARLLSARDRHQEAVALLDPLVRDGGPVRGLTILAALELGRVAERLGQRSRAVESYALVADAWRNGDPEIQPMLEEARAALKRLGSEPGG